jgi:hypothetical protein
MPARSRWWWVGDILASLVLVSTSLAGLNSGPQDLRDAETTMQRIVCYAVITYGITGLLALGGFWLRLRWTIPIMILWGLAGTLAGGLAAAAFAPEVTTWWTSLLAGLICAAIGAPVIWYADRSLRRR